MSDPSNAMTLYPPGTSVRVHGDHDRRGVVTEVRILAPNVLRYRVAWMDGSARQEATVHPDEISATGERKTRVGFHPKDRETKA